MAEEYCWAITQAAGAVLLRLIRFQCAGKWVSSGLPLMYVYSWPYVYSVPTSAEFDLRRTFRNVTTAQVCM